MQMTNTFEVARYGAELKNRIHHMPIGEPLSGPAYGEMLKSKGIGMVLGVVASVVTMGAAAPLMASAVLATQIAGGVMMAGGVLSGVGAVTGNKKLAKIGGILSLAGGVGALASNAMNASGVGGAFSSGSGSEAVSKMAGSFMESVNGVTGADGLGLGNVYNSDAAANAVSGAGYGKDDAGVINRAMADQPGVEMAGEPTAADLAGGQAAPAEAAAPGEIVPAGQAPAAQNPVASEIKLAATDTQSAAPLDQAPSGNSQIDPTNISNEPTAEWKAQVAKNSAAPPPAGSTDTVLGMNKTELMKVGAGFLEKAAAAAFSPDETAKQDALISTYNAQANRYNSATEVEQYQLANSKKQVVMISADDPGMEAKVKDAAAKGHEVAFIPSVGSGGVKQTGANAFTTAQQVSAQQPVRQGVFAKATA